MKCLVFSDVHWCENSSIVRRRGTKYSSRLENLISSINWVEELAWNTGCECAICCGDFFDASVLNSQEISALQEIQWAPISHLFLTGNHETNVSSLEYSTSDLFKLCPNACVLSTPQQYFIENTSVEFCFLPYVLERDRKTITDYFGPATCNRVIFSHNDLKDVQYGSFCSTEGFQISDITENCNLYLNGHIHHCCAVTPKIINIGNLTGQNFTEDATKSTHCAMVLDTETLEYTLYENPYAFNFYKIDATDCLTIEDFKHRLTYLKHNAVLTVQAPENLSFDARAYLDELKELNVEEYRLLIQRQNTPVIESDTPVIVTSDHLQQFRDYILETYGNSEAVQQELYEVVR